MLCDMLRVLSCVQKLRTLHDVAAAHNDAQMCDYIESNLLQEQAQDVKKVSRPCQGPQGKL